VINQNHDYPALYGTLVTFFRCHPYWFIRVQDAQNPRNGLNDKISLSTELWEAICFYIAGRIPVSRTKINKDGTEEVVSDLLWDEVLVDRKLLRIFDELKKLGFFTQKAP
jgi:hypothetical protein